MNQSIDIIMGRRSIRKFSETPVEKEKIEIILKAAMATPTATNARDWKFVVTQNKEMLLKMADANMKYADPLRRATLGILVCGDKSRSAWDFWQVDASAAVQNMIIAAESMGIGSCWLGVWPLEERVKNQMELLGLDENTIPHSLIAFGYPAEGEKFGVSRENRPEYEEDRVIIIE